MTPTKHTKHTPEPWVWDPRYDQDGRLIALLLVTKHRPVPCNDPVIFAVREDWMNHLDKHTTGKADAERIVACVNACTDLPNDIAEEQDSGASLLLHALELARGVVIDCELIDVARKMGAGGLGLKLHLLREALDRLEVK